MNNSMQSSHVDHVTIADIIERRREHYQVGEELLAKFQAGEITAPEYEARLTAHGGDLPRFPAGYSIGPCPPWCTVDHSTESRHTLGEGVREHSHTVASFGDISVDVAATDNLDEGTRSPDAVMVMGADNTLDAGTARWLADALVKAADLLDGHWSPAPRSGLTEEQYDRAAVAEADERNQRDEGEREDV